MVNHPPHDILKGQIHDYGIWPGQCCFGKTSSWMLFTVDKPLKDSDLKRYITLYLEGQYEARAIKFFRTQEGKVKAVWQE